MVNVASGLIHYNFGYIENISIENGLFHKTANHCGAIVTFNRSNFSSIKNSSNKCIVIGKERIGGIAGDNWYGETDNIINCANYGPVIGLGGSQIGGIVGWNAGQVYNCYNCGNVYSKGSQVGGIVGNCTGRVSENYSTYGTILNCYNTGTIKGTSNVGSIVGYLEGYMDNCYYLNNTTLKPYGSKSTASTTCYSGSNVASFDSNGNFTTTLTINNQECITLLDALNQGVHIVNDPECLNWVQGDDFPIFGTQKPVTVKTYTITFHFNDRTTDNTTTKTLTNADKLPMMDDCGWEVDGYEWLGWSLNSNGYGPLYKWDFPAYADGTTFDLYAIYELNNYYIRFSDIANVGATLFNEVNYTVNDDDFIVTFQEPTKEGYNFLYWKINSGTYAGTYYENNTLTIRKGTHENIYAYAYWEEAT